MAKKKIFGTKEWAAHSANVTLGCFNDCRYCYARELSMKLNPDKIWSEEVINEININKPINKKEGTIMFPTAHDITETNIEYVIPYLKKLLEKGNNLLIVSKPRIVCIDRLTKELDYFKDNILFRFTIGGTDNKILSFWEPKAPSYEERKACLKLAFERGFYTSVSAEPLLDIENVDNLILELDPFITDSLWIGKMNKPERRVDLGDMTEKELEFVNEYLDIISNDSFIWKLYNKYKDNKKIKWKESIKEVIGLELSTESGLDK